MKYISNSLDLRRSLHSKELNPELKVNLATKVIQSLNTIALLYKKIKKWDNA